MLTNIETCGEITKLTIGAYEVLIDTHSLPLVLSCGRGWQVYGKTQKHLYARILLYHGGTVSKVRMHRLLLGAKEGEVVDHLSGDTLDNRIGNLRVCTPMENSCNQRQKGPDKYLGVLPRPSGYFTASIRHNTKLIHIGTYLTAEDAARAYNIKSRELRGDAHSFNNIPNPYMEPQRADKRADKRQPYGIYVLGCTVRRVGHDGKSSIVSKHATRGDARIEAERLREIRRDS